MHWVATLAFAFGVWFASLGLVPWPLLSLGLVPGFLMMGVQYRRRGNSWIPFVWNIMFMGAVWMGVRLQYGKPLSEGRKPAIERREPTRWVQAAHERLAASGLPANDVALLDAMLLGNRQYLDNDQKMLFRNAGAQHLLALSGLHLGVFVGLFSFLFLRGVRFSRWRWAGLAAVLLPLWAYCLLVGMPQSLLRAILMTTLFLLAQVSYRGDSPGSTLAVSMLLMLLIDPRCLFDVGTQLSCAAVAALVWLFPPISQMIPVASFPAGRVGWCLKIVWQLFVVSLSAWLGTMPLCLYYFHTLQPWQALVSIFLVPLTTLLLYLALPLLLLSACGIWLLAVPLAKVVSFCVSLEDRVLELAASLPFGTMRLTALHVGHVAIFYFILAMLAIAFQSTHKNRLLAFLFILLSFFILFWI